MLKPKFLIILVWTTVLVHGILIPGPCPQTPATHVMTNDNLPLVKVVRGVAFSNHRQSYIFLDIGPRNANGLEASFLLDHKKEKIIFSLFSRIKEPHLFSHSVLENSNATDNAVFRSTISYKLGETEVQSECHKPITDSVKIWIEEYAVIIWSCVVYTTQHHDGAVLVMTRHKQSNGYASISISELKSLVGKYLPQSLIDKIDWPVDVIYDAYEPNIVNTYIPCSARENAIPFTILFVIIGIIGLAVVWWTSREKCCPKPNNQVGPNPFTN